MNQHIQNIDEAIVVETANSPVRALEMLLEWEPDCIIADYVMSDMDGISFARKVKSEHDLPFILYTGQGSEEVASAAFEAGIDDYLKKEYEKSHFQVLVKRVRMAVEKHKAEETLREKEEQYRRIVQTSPDAITMSDLNGKILATNRQAALLHGYEDEEAMMRSLDGVLDLIVPTDRERAIKNTKKTYESGSVRNVEYNLLRRDGSTFPAELNASTIQGEDGKPVAFIAVVRDISDRHNYQRRLEVLHEHASRLQGASTIVEVAALTFEAVAQVLGFHLGNFSVLENGYLKEIHTMGFDLNEDFLMPLDGKGVTVRAARSGETQLVSDIRLDEDYIIGPVEGYYEPLSELVVPVKVDDEVIAVINLESEQLDAFNNDDQKILEILAGHVASTIHKILLLASERSAQAKIEALHTSSTQLMKARSSEETFDIALNVIQSVLGFHWGGIGRVVGDRIFYVKTIGAELPVGSYISLDSPSITARAIKSRRSQLVLDTRLDGDYVRLSDSEGQVKRNLSELAVPIFVSDRVEGVINIESQKLNAFSEVDRRLLEILAQHIGSALTRLTELERLRDSERRFKSFIEGSLDSVSVNVGTRITYVNQELVKLLGYNEPSDLIGRDITELFPVELRDDIRERTLRRQRGEEEPQKYETVFQRCDGSTIDIESVLSVINIDGEKATLAYARDITERKEYESKLDALHKLAVGLTKVETEEEIAKSTLNAIEKILGYNYMSFALVEGDFLNYRYVRGKTMIDRLPLSGSGITVWALNTGEIQYVPDTRISRYYISSRDVKEPESLSELDVPIFVNGAPTALINIESDKLDAFSERDKNIVEILSMHAASALTRIKEVTRLEALVEEKTRELLEGERLIAAGRIASMVGHDLRGPLQNIDVALGLLDGMPSEYESILDTIKRSVRRASDLLEEIRSHIKDTPMSVASIDVVTLIRRLLNEKILPNNIEVSLESEIDELEIDMDLNKIYRVFDNLVQNAVEAMPEGGRLTIRVSNDGENALISVSDTGEGIPEELLPKLFTLFVTTKNKGTGLGLAFCRRAINAHRGTISVDTKLGEGTTFTVKLPLRKAPELPIQRLGVANSRESSLSRNQTADTTASGKEWPS